MPSETLENLAYEKMALTAKLLEDVLRRLAKAQTCEWEDDFDTTGGPVLSP